MFHDKEDRSLKADNDELSNMPQPASSKRDWRPMKLTHVGEAKDVVQQGGGKTSPNPADPGEVFKPPGSKT